VLQIDFFVGQALVACRLKSNVSFLTGLSKIYCPITFFRYLGNIPFMINITNLIGKARDKPLPYRNYWGVALTKSGAGAASLQT
jgi:hypothetical protein